MKFKVGDEVRVIEEASGVLFSDTVGDVCKIKRVDNEDGLIYELDNGFLYRADCLEPITDHDNIMDKIMERNNEPEQEDINDKVNRPTHYKNGNKDLFDELYERLYHDERLYTGREVFIIVMKFVAERYIRRYPNKNEEDLQKGIYTLERLKEYEELEEV